MTFGGLALHGWEGVPPSRCNKIRVWMDREGTPDWVPSKMIWGAYPTPLPSAYRVRIIFRGTDARGSLPGVIM